MSNKKKQKPVVDSKCDDVGRERFQIITEDVFRINWWEIFCFPYIICSRVWDCCASLCSGNNQCLIYWMMIQWVVCKISKLTTPNPMIFPYYFYMYCQVLLLTIVFVFIWACFGRSVFIPFIMSIYNTFMEIDDTASANTTRLSFRRYCFRKGEIFDSSFKSSSVMHKNTPIFNVVFTFIDIFIFNLFNQ